MKVVQSKKRRPFDVIDAGPWTQFWDMHSGGGQKEAWSQIYIQAPESEAISIFYSRFGHNPHRVTCTCCGDDYSISESKSLSQATGFHRGCGYDKKGKYVEEPDTSKWGTKEYQSMKEFLKSFKFPEGGTALLIFKDEIKNEERNGYVPEQGYVWQD
jgi:hypothetical protein